MRHIFTVLLIYLSYFSANAGAQESYYQGEFPAQTSAFVATQLTVQQLPRDVWIYRPKNAVNPSLLIFFTGTGGTLAESNLDHLGKQFVQDFADREGVVVAFPLPHLINHTDWAHPTGGNAYWEMTASSADDAPVLSDPSNNADLQLVQAIIDESSRAYQIDTNRIYLNGFSSGAFFSYFTAAVFHDQIAAFSESGGGLVLSHTTDGDPVCHIDPLPGESGAVRDCAASGWTPQSCVSANAIPRPIAVENVSWVPPGFLRADDDDATIPFAHTCNLAAALNKSTDVVVEIIHDGGGHSIGGSVFWDKSWAFMRDKRLEAPLFKAADSVFNYIENQYSEFFPAPGTPSRKIGSDFYHRYYPGTQGYLGYKNHTIYYYLPESGLQEAGPLDMFLPLANQQ